MFVHRINKFIVVSVMHQKHVVPHPDQSLCTVPPESNLPLFTLTSNLIQKIVQIFIYLILISNITVNSFLSIYLFYFIIVYFGNFRGGKNRGVPGPGPYFGGPGSWTRSTEGSMFCK